MTNEELVRRFTEELKTGQLRDRRRDLHRRVRPPPTDPRHPAKMA
jgi:hypothetical protein